MNLPLDPGSVDGGVICPRCLHSVPLVGGRMQPHVRDAGDEQEVCPGTDAYNASLDQGSGDRL